MSDDARRGLVLGYSGDAGVAHACATRLQSLGAEIAVTTRPGREAALRDAERAGFPAFAVDATDDRAIAETVARIGRWWGRLDFVIHAWVNAPVDALARPLHELSREDFARTLDVSTYSLIAATRAALPLLRRSRAPRIVTMTSPAALRATQGYHAVAIAKAALAATVRHLATDLGVDGVTCNAVSFSAIDTAGARRVLGERAIAAVSAHLAKRGPLRRAIDRDDVAEAVAFLCDERCRGITGEILTVDGGFANTYL